MKVNSGKQVSQYGGGQGGSGIHSSHSSQTSQSSQSGGYAYSTKNFYAFPPGTTFKAMILDIQPGKVKIRLDSGGSFTARSKALPDARIGEESYFRVKVNNLDGLIQLEMIKGSPEARQDNLVQEALKSANMYSFDENLELGRALIENNLPLDAQTLQKAAFFLHSQPSSSDISDPNISDPDISNSSISRSNISGLPDLHSPASYSPAFYSPIEKTLFLLQEGFPPDSASLRGLDNALDPDMHLAKLLEGLTKSIINLPPSDAKENMSEILSQDSLFIPLSTNSKSLRQFYKELRQALSQLQDQISNLEGEIRPQISQEIRGYLSTIHESLNFIQHCTKQVQYYQIPFMAHGQTKQGELFVYRDKNQSGSALDKKANVLIALDTGFLGRVEVLTYKDDKQLTFQFKGDTAEVLSLLKSKSPGLSQSLEQKGFKISGLSYQKRTERTTVLSPSPVKEGTEAKGTGVREEPKRYSFDMRV